MKLKPWRCVICGRFVSYREEVVDVSHTEYMAYEPAEPEWAHKKCGGKS